MKIAVLFDGAGLARYGLEQAGHDCVGFEIDPWKHLLSRCLGSGNCILADATKVDLTDFDGVWASPPCQTRSRATLPGTTPLNGYHRLDYTQWCLETLNALNLDCYWIENVVTFDYSLDHLLVHGESKGVYNAAQFTERPLQNRNRIVCGRFRKPRVYRRYQQRYKEAIPCIMASEYHGSSNDNRRAARHFGRKLTLTECAYYQGLPQIPEQWLHRPDDFPGDRREWFKVLYEAIGNGVPPYMSKAFGESMINNHDANWVIGCRN